MPSAADHTERLTARGQVIELSVTMESRLRDVFCALVESKYAAVVAGGQTADWLIEQSKALVDAHHEMPDASRQAIKAAPNRCKAPNEQRNILTHSVAVGVRSDPAFRMVRSRRHTYDSDVRPFTLAEIREAANDHAALVLGSCASVGFGVVMSYVALGEDRAGPCGGARAGVVRVAGLGWGGPRSWVGELMGGGARCGGRCGGRCCSRMAAACRAVAGASAGGPGDTGLGR
jgi:hypothetical protein